MSKTVPAAGSHCESADHRVEIRFRKMKVGQWEVCLISFGALCKLVVPFYLKHVKVDSG